MVIVNAFLSSMENFRRPEAVTPPPSRAHPRRKSHCKHGIRVAGREKQTEVRNRRSAGVDAQYHRRVKVGTKTPILFGRAGRLPAEKSPFCLLSAVRNAITGIARDKEALVNAILCPRYNCHAGSVQRQRQCWSAAEVLSTNVGDTLRQSREVSGAIHNHDERVNRRIWRVAARGTARCLCPRVTELLLITDSMNADYQ